MTVLPCPGESACNAPRPNATASDVRITIGVRSRDWKSAETPAPKSLIPFGTAAPDAGTGADPGPPGVPEPPADATGVASGAENGGNAGPPAVAVQVAERWSAGVVSRSAGYCVSRCVRSSDSAVEAPTVVPSPRTTISRQPRRST